MNAIERRKNWILVCTLAAITIVVNSTAQFKHTFLEDDTPPRRTEPMPTVPQPIPRSEVETRFAPVSAPAQPPTYITKAAVREEPRTFPVTPEPDPELEFVSEMAPVETVVYPAVTRPKEPHRMLEKQTSKRDENPIPTRTNVPPIASVPEKANAITNAPKDRVAHGRDQNKHRLFASPRQRDSIAPRTQDEVAGQAASAKEKSSTVPSIAENKPAMEKKPLPRTETPASEEKKQRPRLFSFRSHESQPRNNDAAPHLFSFPGFSRQSHDANTAQVSPKVPAQQPQRSTGESKVLRWLFPPPDSPESPKTQPQQQQPQFRQQPERQRIAPRTFQPQPPPRVQRNQPPQQQNQQNQNGTGWHR